MKRAGSLDELIRRARRRRLWNLAVRQAAQAVCFSMAGLILVLLLGTQILDWRWLAAPLAAGVVVGFRNLRRDAPSPYAVAQSIDRRMGLHDSLSTAFFYHRLQPGRQVSEEVRAAQFAQAERLAREVPLHRAAPFAAPKSLYAMVALGLVASGLLTLRYGISRTLDLRPPLAKIVFEPFHFAAQARRPGTGNKNAEPKRVRELLKQFGLSLGSSAENQSGEPERAAGSTLETASAPDSRSDSARTRQGGAQPLQTGEQLQREAKAGSAPEAEESSEGAQASGQPPPNRQASHSPSESSGLLDKFRDAMANLLSRLKPQPRSGDSKQMASSAQGGSDQAQSQQGQKGAPAGAKQADGRPGGEPPGERQGEGLTLPQGGPGKPGGPDGEQLSRDGRNGVGREDGSKELREAEQLAAMGKISEIIGKRSQNLTGEVVVEVASSSQQLRTAYSRQDLSHAEAGGEIHRDEIPLAYQRYVRQYFEEIRKAAPPAPRKQP